MDKRDRPTKPPQTFKIQIRYNHQLQSFNKREFYEKYFQSVCLFNRIFFKRSVGTGLKIAAAANLTHALKALVKEFQKEHSKDAISISALILQANSTLKSFKTPLLIYSFQQILQILLDLKSFMMKK